MILTLTVNPAIDLYIEVDDWVFGGEVNRAKLSRRMLGGKGINVSRTAHALGAPTRALMLAGEESAQLVKKLTKDDPFEIVTVPGPGEVRTNIHILQTLSDDSLKINQPGVPPGGALEKLRRKFATMLKKEKTKLVVLSGSLPPECPPELYRELIELATSHRVPVVLDAEGDPLKEALKAGPTVVKPNRRELAATVGHALPTLQDVQAAARELQQAGARSVVVTDGERPTLAILGDNPYLVVPPDIEGGHPTGAGDAFTAGLAAGLLWEWPEEKILRLASAAGSAACLSHERAQLTEKIDKLIPGVTVEPLRG